MCRNWVRHARSLMTGNGHKRNKSTFALLIQFVLHIHKPFYKTPKEKIQLYWKHIMVEQPYRKQAACYRINCTMNEMLCL